MKSSWLKGLDPERVKDVRGDYLSSLVTRKRLIEICEERIKTADKTSLNKEGYDIANWALKQADLIGYKRAIEEIINLINE